MLVEGNCFARGSVLALHAFAHTEDIPEFAAGHSEVRLKLTVGQVSFRTMTALAGMSLLTGAQLHSCFHDKSTHSLSALSLLFRYVDFFKYTQLLHMTL